MNSEIEYKQKYEKYKAKYLKLKEEQKGGVSNQSGFYYIFFNSKEPNNKSFLDKIKMSGIKNNDYFKNNKHFGSKFNNLVEFLDEIPYSYYTYNTTNVLQPTYKLHNVGMKFARNKKVDMAFNYHLVAVKKGYNKNQLKEVEKLLLIDVDDLKISCKTDNSNCFNVSYSNMYNKYSDKDILSADENAKKIMLESNNLFNSYIIIGVSNFGNYYIHSKTFDDIKVPDIKLIQKPPKDDKKFTIGDIDRFLIYVIECNLFTFI